MKPFNLAIVGATGMVGRTFLTVLEEKNLPIKELYLYASKHSAATFWLSPMFSSTGPGVDT